MQATWEGTKVSTRRGLALHARRAADDGVRVHDVTESDRLPGPGRLRAWPHPPQGSSAAPALAALKEAVGVDPGVAEYHDTLGLVLLELGRPDLAIPEFQKAVEIDPKSADAHFHLGTAYAETGRWEDAVASYRKALALPTLGVPDFVHQNLGLALYHLRRYPEAESSLRVCTIPRPADAGRLLQLGPRPGRREPKRGGQGRLSATCDGSIPIRPLVKRRWSD